jgi:threonine dehydrogenase-like Zn-dependent dehydrogenase
MGKGNYPFPRNDKVVSSQPPTHGRCFACGSDKHWLNHCPNKDAYKELRKRQKNGKSASLQVLPPISEDYESAQRQAFAAGAFAYGDDDHPF